jgi:CHASE2 domain-containing sensor protein
MTYNDTIGTIGVGLILLAYFLNTARLLPKDGKLFFTLNIIGAALACYASFLINYWPFVILEGTWTLVSIYGLMKTMRIKIT